MKMCHPFVIGVAGWDTLWTIVSKAERRKVGGKPLVPKNFYASLKLGNELKKSSEWPQLGPWVGTSQIR